MSTKVATPAPADFSFEDVAIPVVTRSVTSKVNPFTPKVAGLVSAWNEADNRSNGAVALTVPRANLTAIQRQISLAGHAANVSMRMVKAPIDGDTTNVRLTFWAVGRITRKPATAATSVAAPATA